MNYADLFHVLLPETALEVAALVVLIADLAFLRHAALRTRAAVAAALGVLGCLGSLWAIGQQSGFGFEIDGQLILSTHGIAAAASAGIVILSAITLLLLVESSFTKHVGEYVAIVLMAAAGGQIAASAQDLLVIFVGLELLSLSLYVLTAFNKQSGKSAEAALKYYLFGGMSAAFLLFGFSYFYGLAGSTNLAVIQQNIAQTDAAALHRLDSGRRRPRLQDRRCAFSPVGSGCIRGRTRVGRGVYRFGLEGRQLRAAADLCLRMADLPEGLYA
jgi:NADH-quinone oxidoreductase subunit N